MLKNEYNIPPLDLLNQSKILFEDKEIKIKQLEKILNSYNVKVRVVDAIKTGIFTRYYLKPKAGTSIKDINRIKEDIQLRLNTKHLEISSIPEKQVVVIDSLNRSKEKLYLGNCFASDIKGYNIPLCFGKDMNNQNIILDLTKTNHIMITGTTGTGKSSVLDAFILSIVYNCDPEKVKLVLIDLEELNFRLFKGIPHLLIPVIENEVKILGALNYIFSDLENRYKKFKELGVKNIEEYNLVATVKLPSIVIMFEDFASCIYTGSEKEYFVYKIIQMGRAAGIYIIISTQRSSIDIISGEIKANILTRLTFKLPAVSDSKTVLNHSGAEKLLEVGDALLINGSTTNIMRVQTPFVSAEEISGVLNWITVNNEFEFDKQIIEEIDKQNKTFENDIAENDDLLPLAMDMAESAGEISVSTVQRRFKIGYSRAASIVEQMESLGLVSRDYKNSTRAVWASQKTIELSNKNKDNEFDVDEMETQIVSDKKTEEQLKAGQNKMQRLTGEDIRRKIKSMNIPKYWWLWLILLILIYKLFA